MVGGGNRRGREIVRRGSPLKELSYGSVEIYIH